MPFLANDKLDPARSHGDVLLTISSAHEDVNLFALRQLTRATRGTMALHWMLDGYNRRTEAGPGEAGRAQPHGLRRRHGQPAARRRRRHGPLRLGPVRRRRTGVGGRRLVPRGAGDPDVRRVLGPHPAVGAGGADRAAQGGRRPARRSARDRHPGLRRRSRRARSPRSTPTSAWPTPAPPRPPTTSSSARASASPAASTAAAASTRASPSCPTSAPWASSCAPRPGWPGEPLEEYIQPQGGGFFYALPGAPQGDVARATAVRLSAPAAGRSRRSRCSRRVTPAGASTGRRRWSVGVVVALVVADRRADVGHLRRPHHRRRTALPPHRHQLVGGPRPRRQRRAGGGALPRLPRGRAARAGRDPARRLPDRAPRSAPAAHPGRTRSVSAAGSGPSWPWRRWPGCWPG